MDIQKRFESDFKFDGFPDPVCIKKLHKKGNENLKRGISKKEGKKRAKSCIMLFFCYNFGRVGAKMYPLPRMVPKYTLDPNKLS